MAALLDDWVKFEALVQIFVGSMMWPRSRRNFMMESSSTSSPLAGKSSIQVPTAIHVLTNHIYKRLSNNLDYSKFRQVSRRLNMDNQYLWISLNNFLTRQRRKYKTFVFLRQKRIDHESLTINAKGKIKCVGAFTKLLSSYISFNKISSWNQPTV